MIKSSGPRQQISNRPMTGTRVTNAGTIPLNSMSHRPHNYHGNTSNTATATSTLTHHMQNVLPNEASPNGDQAPSINLSKHHQHHQQTHYQQQSQQSISQQQQQQQHHSHNTHFTNTASIQITQPNVPQTFRQQNPVTSVTVDSNQHHQQENRNNDENPAEGGEEPAADEGGAENGSGGGGGGGAPEQAKAEEKKGGCCTIV